MEFEERARTERRIEFQRSSTDKARLLRVKYGLPPLPDGPLPEGLAYHCDACGVVVPADAPRPEGGDCEFVAKHRLAFYKREETLAGRFCMAVAAWALIYHQPLKDNAHAESNEYLRQFKQERKAHFGKSAARQAMAPEHIELEGQHKRDGWLYAPDAS